MTPKPWWVKGQLYSSDALLSLVVFALALAIVAGLNLQLASQADVNHQTYARDAAAARTLHTLLSSQGNPTNWELLSDRNSVNEVGIMGHRSGISPAKWAALVDWNGDDYPSLAQSMGLGDFNFYLSISDVNRELVSGIGTQPIDVNNVSVVLFPSVFNAQPVMVQIQVYRP